MWELVYKKGRALKNWRFWIVVLEKTLGNLLDCKEIKSLILKEINQPWIFIGKAVAEAEVPILWPLDVKNRLTGKDPDAGKDWRQKEKTVAEEEMVRGGHWLNGHDFEHRLAKGWTQLSDWTITPPLILSLRDKILSPSLPFLFPNRVERIISIWLKYGMLLKITEGTMDAR